MGIYNALFLALFLDVLSLSYIASCSPEVLLNREMSLLLLFKTILLLSAAALKNSFLFTFYLISITIFVVLSIYYSMLRTTERIKIMGDRHARDYNERE